MNRHNICEDYQSSICVLEDGKVNCKGIVTFAHATIMEGGETPIPMRVCENLRKLVSDICSNRCALYFLTQKLHAYTYAVQSTPKL